MPVFLLSYFNSYKYEIVSLPGSFNVAYRLNMFYITRFNCWLHYFGIYMIYNMFLLNSYFTIQSKYKSELNHHRKDLIFLSISCVFSPVTLEDDATVILMLFPPHVVLITCLLRSHRAA